MPDNGGDGGFGFSGGGLMMVAILGAVALVVFAVVALLGLSVLGGVTDSIQPGDDHDAAASDVGNWSSFGVDDDTTGLEDDSGDFLVRDSRGYAVDLKGTENSYVRSNSKLDVTTNESWTVCTWASVDSESQDKTMSALSVGGDLVMTYNGSTDHWAAWYYKDGGRSSYRVDVPASNQPGGLSLVCVEHDGEYLSISEDDGGAGGYLNTSEPGIAEGSLDAQPWDGRLEETRTFNGTLSASEQTQLYGDPVAPLPSANRTARLYYDNARSSEPIFFASTSATVNNANWDDGHSGTVLTAGEDYELDEENQRIRVLAGSPVDGAPAVWIDWYPNNEQIDGVTGGVSGGFQLLATAALVIPAIVVLTLLVGVVVLIRKFGGGLGDRGRKERRR